MNWDRIIDLNRASLMRLVRALFASIGLVPGGVTVDTLPRHVHLKVLRVLRPAESVLRRLIVIMDRLNALKGEGVRVRGASSAPTGRIPRGDRKTRVPAFPLIDPRKRFDQPVRRRPKGPGPRIWFFDGSDPPYEPYVEPPAPAPDDRVGAGRLCGRLQALHGALLDMPRQAKRLARLMARREQAPPGPRRVPPLRPGWPPGYRQRHAHEIDELLRNCHALAMHALEPQDSS